MPLRRARAAQILAATIGLGLAALVGVTVAVDDRAPEPQNVAATTRPAPPLPAESEEPEASREGEPDEGAGASRPTPTRTASERAVPKDTPRPTRTTGTRAPATPTAKPKPAKPKPTEPVPAARAAAVGTAAENEVVRLTNAARAKAGCAPLRHDADLRAAALAHSKDMAARGYFDHDSPDGEGPGDRIRGSGFAPIGTWGENIAAGQRTAAEVVAGWMDSPGHKANILTCAYTHIGVGFADRHWTQNFAGH